MIRVIVADDHTIFREGIRSILSKTSDIEVVCETVNGQELLDKILKSNYDIVLLDIKMPGKSGLEILKDIKNIKPNLPVLMFSMYPEKRFAIRSLKLKASGYLTKDSASEELVTAIRKIHSGGKYVSMELAEQLASTIDGDYEKPQHEKLTQREYEIMIKIAEGRKIIEIAEEMFLASTTVSTYRSRILEKLGVQNDASIIRYVIENKLID